MFKQLLALGLFNLVAIYVVAQGVSINNNGNAAHSSAMLDVSSTNSGILIPRMDSASAAAITNPATSLLIYQTDKDSGFYYYDGANWIPILNGGAGTNAGWTLKGNTGTAAGTNFIGTTDAIDWVIKTNNTERMRVLSGGNIGIGTATANRRLEVLSNAAPSNLVGVLASSGSSNLVINENATNHIYMQMHDAAGNTNIQLNPGGVVHFNNSDNVAIGETDPDALLEISASSGTDDLLFLSSDDDNDGDLMVVKNNGRVGIGTSSPSTMFNVSTSGTNIALFEGSNSVDNLWIELDNTATTPSNTGLRIENNSSPALDLVHDGGNNFFIDVNGYANVAADGDPEVTITSTGNVGIGTTSPSRPFHVTHEISGSGNGASVLLERTFTAPLSAGSNTTMGIRWDTEDSNGDIQTSAGIYGGLSDNTDGSHKGVLRFYTAETGSSITQQMTIIENGNVGIGDASPDYQLDMEGSNSNEDLYTTMNNTTSTISNTTYSHWRIEEKGVTGFDMGYNHGTQKFHFENRGNINTSTDGGVDVTIDVNGNVGIGTTNPSHLLHVSGVTRSTQATWDISSDKRVKTNIRDIDDGLETLLKFRPVEFEYTKEYQKYNEGYAGKKRGFIAQEVKEILPEMITVIEETYGNKTIKDFNLLNSNDFTPMLVKAIQEQQQIIENQNNRIKNLELTNDKLKAETVSKKDHNQLKAELEEIKKILNQETKK